MSIQGKNNSISDILQDRFTFSMEFFPPRTPERKKIFDTHLSKLEKLQFDFCSITYGAGGTTTELTPEYVVSLADRFNVPTIAHLTCIDHTINSLNAELDIYDENSIKNILALRGDPKESEITNQKNEIPYALNLLEILRARGNYCVGVAAHPEGHTQSDGNDFDFQADKIVRADYAITQLFYDVDYYERFIEMMSKKGVETPIIPGVLPLTNLSRIAKIIQLSGATIPDKVLASLSAHEDGSDEQRKLGEDLTVKMCEKLREIGAPGLHFYTMNRADSVQAIFERLR